MEAASHVRKLFVVTIALALLAPVASATHDPDDPLNGHVSIERVDPEIPTIDTITEIVHDAVREGMDALGKVLQRAPKSVRDALDPVIHDICPSDLFWDAPWNCISIPGVIQTLCVTFERVSTPAGEAQKPVVNTDKSCGFIEPPEI